MRLAFLVNAVATEVDEYTTTRLARAAAQRDHEVWYVGVEDVELGESDGQLLANAHAAVFTKGDSLEGFMNRVKERDAERIVMDDLDALFLRNESLEDWPERPWAGDDGSGSGITDSAAIGGRRLWCHYARARSDPVPPL